MLIDAIVLAGGRSSRLGGTPKAELLLHGRSLLSHALDAVTAARRVVLVGPLPPAGLPPGVLLTRERPPFGGPAAAIAAGMAALAASESAPSTHTLVLACDMPGIGPAVGLLLAAAAADPTGDGAIGLDGQRRQPLAAVYRSARLAAAINGRRGAVTGLSMGRLIGELHPQEVQLPAHSSDDVDSWDDAARLGVQHPPATPDQRSQHEQRSQHDQTSQHEQRSQHDQTSQHEQRSQHEHA